MSIWAPAHSVWNSTGQFFLQTPSQSATGCNLSDFLQSGQHRVVFSVYDKQGNVIWHLSVTFMDSQLIGLLTLTAIHPFSEPASSCSSWEPRGDTLDKLPVYIRASSTYYQIFLFPENKTWQFQIKCSNKCWSSLGPYASQPSVMSLRELVRPSKYLLRDFVSFVTTLWKVQRFSKDEPQNNANKRSLCRRLQTEG